MMYLSKQPGEFVGAVLEPSACEGINPYDTPEIALMGRSNVGKSTLMNALLGTKALVKTSKHPGRTKGVRCPDDYGYVFDNICYLHLPHPCTPIQHTTHAHT